MIIKVIHKGSGKIYAMDKWEYEKRMDEFDPWKELKKEKRKEKDLSYSELKEKAKDLGIEFKGNIGKAKLKELIEG